MNQKELKVVINASASKEIKKSWNKFSTALNMAGLLENTANNQTVLGATVDISLNSKYELTIKEKSFNGETKKYSLNESYFKTLTPQQMMNSLTDKLWDFMFNDFKNASRNG